MNAGTTPKLTASANESISSPIFEVAFEQPGDATVERVQIAGRPANAIASVGRSSWANFTAVKAETDRRDSHRAGQETHADGRPFDAGSSWQLGKDRFAADRSLSEQDWRR